MIDFRVTYARAVLPFNHVRPVRDFHPPSIVVIGERLNLAEEVVYNGVEAEEFMISSPTMLVIRIPESQVGKDLTELRIFTTPKSVVGDASVRLGLPTPVQKVTGVDRLVQQFLMVFLSTPGSDVFSLNSGGGALSLIGKTTDRMHTSVAADLAQAVERTNSELLRLQGKSTRIPPSERLLSATLDSVKYDPDTTVVSAKVSIRNMLGEEALVSAAR